jgi:hypothetical protein
MLGGSQRRTQHLAHAVERPRCRWEDNIKMNVREVGWGMDWIDLAEDRNR